MATSVAVATGLSSSFHGGWGSSICGEDRGMLVGRTWVRVAKPIRSSPVMKNVNEGKGIFAPLVVVTRNVIGKKRFNQLRGKAIALHSQKEVRLSDWVRTTGNLLKLSVGPLSKIETVLNKYSHSSICVTTQSHIRKVTHVRILAISSDPAYCSIETFRVSSRNKIVWVKGSKQAISGDKMVSKPRREDVTTQSHIGKVITEFCKSIGADGKQRQGLIRLAKKNGEWLGFLA